MNATNQRLGIIMAVSITSILFSVTSDCRADERPKPGDVSTTAILSEGKAPSCPIRISSRYKAVVDNGGFRLPAYGRGYGMPAELKQDHRPIVDGIKQGMELVVGMTCFSTVPGSDDHYRFEGLHDEVTDTWRLDFSAEDPKLRAQSLRTYRIFPIQARNSSGAVVTEDDPMRDPEVRVRFLSFCLLKPPLALCGRSDHVKRLADPKSDMQPYLLSVIRSIEFIDPSEVETPPPDSTGRR